MLVWKEADILELTEIIEGNFAVRCLHSLREVEVIVVVSSIVDSIIEIFIFFFVLLLVFLLFLLFFIFINFWFFIIRMGEVVNMTFISLCVEIVFPFDGDWLCCFDGVLTLSVDVLEKVESGGK